ncbi:MAG: glycosyltransferase family 39 protein [Dysgonamonadaceae bacterium]|jgi:4-amino-4-deoxy-L-arabinose transferase-like glycosyltransferase|nr:glycosyltransferase family 39 protein [Dysgonamonadaceae bacterium]
MRTPTLQYLYLQKPLVLLLIVTIVSVCWIYAGDFYTKGEPREASVAVSMVEQNNWILPKVYADEIAYKPPLAHWLMAAFSLPRGSVSVLSARLPSAIAFVWLIGACFLFFGRRVKGQKAFLTCMLLITSFELHRAAMTARVDMVLTALIVLGLFCLFRWEDDKKLKGFPIVTVFILSCAILVKGPVGIVLPLFVFGVYLLILKYNFWEIAGKFVLIAFASMVLPAIWYYLAYKQGGQEFLDLVWAENFGRFFGGEVNISYSLGHEMPFWFNFVTLATGFIPWTLLLIMSLFVIKYSFKFPGFKKIWSNMLSMSKVKLFSLVAAVLIVFFYCIPISKRSVYLMPAYPFIAVFIAQYILYLVKNKSKIIRIFSIIIGSIGILVALIVLLTVVTQLVEPAQLVGFIKNERILSDIAVIWSALTAPNLLYVVLFSILVGFIYILFNLQRKKNNLKILYATIATYLAIFAVMDGIFIPAFKSGASVEPFAKEITSYNSENETIYVVNDLRQYANMYGVNFYLHNSFRNFEKELPASGLLLIGENDYKKLFPHYENLYDFSLLKQSDGKMSDNRQVTSLYSFYKKDGL